MGVPMTRRSAVLSPARRSVSQTAVRSSFVTIAADALARRRASQVVQEAARRGVSRAAGKQHRVLAQRRMKLLRDRPMRRAPVDLREGDETRIGIAAGDKLESL